MIIASLLSKTSALTLWGLAATFLVGCQDNAQFPKVMSQQFAARERGESTFRPLIYCANVPTNWVRQSLSLNESLADTTKANCEFHISEEGQLLKITFHTFPFQENAMRISPKHQVERWKNQFDVLNTAALKIIPVSQGGFAGLYFEAEGIIDETPKKVIGWSMQLASIFEQNLIQTSHPLNLFKRADYTIKARGAPELMEKHRLVIAAFAASFELIDEFPFSP